MIEDIDLDHVAVATERQADAWPRYVGELGGVWLSGGGTPGFDAAQVQFANGMKVEVLEPYLVERNDFLRRFLDRNGPGPHHLTFKVKDIRAALTQAEAAGYRPVGVNLSEPQWQEAFLHPKDAPGVVVQLAQSGGGDWVSPAPADLPAAGPTATLLHVAHAVRDRDTGLKLFQDLLGGEEDGHGEDVGVPYVDLRWPGPGRVRLLVADPRGPVGAWVGEREGRVHHVAFEVPAGGADIADAVPFGDRVEVPPEHNLGVRLLVQTR
jgi:methylmalonyl-CoA/ethylmalonyl-CoA epimerase